MLPSHLLRRLLCCAVLLQYNIFGRTFRSVLEHPDCNIMWDDSREAFDSAVVYVNKASIQVRRHSV